MESVIDKEFLQGVHDAYLTEIQRARSIKRVVELVLEFEKEIDRLTNTQTPEEAYDRAMELIR